MMVHDMRPGRRSSDPSGLADVGGTLFFSATDGSHVSELWKSDGTAAGTVMVRSRPSNSEPYVSWGLNPGAPGSNHGQSYIARGRGSSSPEIGGCT